MDAKLLTRLRLWEFPDKYIFEPVDGNSDSILKINRNDGSMEIIGEVPQNAQNVKIKTVYGIVGMIKLLVGSYIVVIKERENVGTYLNNPIFKITSLQILPCNISLTASSQQKKMEAEFTAILKASERISGLYFSYEVNLTLCSQRLNDLGNESKSLPLWRQAEPRFLWNNYLMEPLIENKLDQYLLPVIQGYYENFSTKIGSKNVDLFLIARRCTRRIGTRLWRRGADKEGYVANFVESEQIVQSDGFSASFVQVRGSMPFMWEQTVDLTYKPSFDIIKNEDSARVVERHFLDLSKKYGSVLAADLVNTNGSEGRLHDIYANSIQPILSDEIRYVHFDFHKICGHVHFERLSILYAQIEDYLKTRGYFLINKEGEKVKEQTGVVRTNCIDCLDRTNVTQNMIARKILESQLKEMGVFDENNSISDFSSFDTSYKIMWANHGDEISTQYSGTPALKGDFTRYGKRTFEGIAKDGWNALSRYYLNNFADGTRQDAIDLLQGHYIVSVSRDITPQIKPGLVQNYASFRVAFVVILMTFLFALMSLKQAGSGKYHLMMSVIWTGLTVGLTSFVRANGRHFTNRPRFIKNT